jgi:hypothetical protein
MEHHHHHHHRKDSATRFKEKSLRAIEFRRLFEKYLKIAVVILAIVMVVLVILAYTLG